MEVPAGVLVEAGGVVVVVAAAAELVVEDEEVVELVVEVLPLTSCERSARRPPWVVEVWAADVVCFVLVGAGVV